MKVIIDRFEASYAVVELDDKTMVDLPKVLVPEGASEGDVLEIAVSVDKTNERKQRIEKLTEDLWE